MPDFNANTVDTPVVDNTSDAKPEAKQPDTFVFEHKGRKFSKDDLAKKLDHADSFIETLKKENAERDSLLEKATAALEKNISMSEMLAKIKQGREDEEVEENVVDNTPSFDASALSNSIKNEILSTLSNAEKSKRQGDNFNNVKTKLTAVYKDQVNDVVAKVAAENDLTIEEAESMAKNKPSIFLKLFPELNGKSPKAYGLPSSRHSVPQGYESKPAISGYGKAKSTKDSVDIYLKRLAELNG